MKTFKIAMIFTILAFCTSFSASAEDTVVFELSGNGTRNTRPFTVRDRWEVKWDARTEHLAIHLYTAKGEAQGMLPIATQDGPGRGATFRPDGGSYYLKIIAQGDWSIAIVQLP